LFNSQKDKDIYFLEKTIQLAKKAFDEDEVPVGALLVDSNDTIISAHYNNRQHSQIVTGHAEILCLQEANQKLSSWRLEDCSLYSSLEPCLMCAGALISARIKRVVYACEDKKGGGQSCARLFSDVVTNHKVEFQYIQLKESQDLLKQFFKIKRNKK
tara:strand:+ start:25 stop:495 length:471 start_codon:yes stop_codon:yes gene_type:complete